MSRSAAVTAMPGVFGGSVPLAGRSKSPSVIGIEVVLSGRETVGLFQSTEKCSAVVCAEALAATAAAAQGARERRSDDERTRWGGFMVHSPDETARSRVPARGRCPRLAGT
jgi:hypothetical protein